MVTLDIRRQEIKQLISLIEQNIGPTVQVIIKWL